MQRTREQNAEHCCGVVADCVDGMGRRSVKARARAKTVSAKVSLAFIGVLLVRGEEKPPHLYQVRQPPPSRRLLACAKAPAGAKRIRRFFTSRVTTNLSRNLCPRLTNGKRSTMSILGL